MLVRADEAALAKIEQAIVHQLHPLFFPGLDDAGKHVRLGFTDDVRDRGRVG